MSRWFVVGKPKPRARYRLFCAPYAGGSASAYTRWDDLLPAEIELVAIQPPGRANRLSEPLLTSIPQMAEQLAQAIPSWLDRPYLMYGHSLGSVVSFELLHALHARRLALPRRFICGARRAPQLPPRIAPIHDYPLERFKQELRKLNGTPEAILENQELMEIFVPVLRSDFKAAYTYARQPVAQLPVDASIFCGAKDDTVLPEDMQGWRAHFSGAVDFRTFDGGHFFMDENAQSVINAICESVGLAPKGVSTHARAAQPEQALASAES